MDTVCIPHFVKKSKEKEKQKEKNQKKEEKKKESKRKMYIYYSRVCAKQDQNKAINTTGKLHFKHIFLSGKQCYY